MGLLRRNESEARELSRELRNDKSGNMRRRRAVVGLSSIGATSLGLIGLYQTGIIKHLPEPPLPHLDAEKVDASPEAYEWLSTPDAVLGVASYGATMTLAAMGGDDRAVKQPFIPIALAAKTALDVFNAARLTRDQWTKHRAFCIWCLIAAGATFASVPFVVPEAVEAVRNLTFGGPKLVRKAA
ncbi:MAG TPA: vitamin K epoxide reductase family protein [Terriglobales bacterium]|nr:vitamin K epoxide reductase family protein [Terriglobales bacterium]